MRVPAIPTEEDSVPTYQYSCTACGHQLEVVQSFTDPSLTVCPECEGSLRKLFSGVGVVFKGSGFYRTDSRASATKPSSSTSSTSSSSSGSSSSSSASGTGSAAS
jgi:putative FmdB family regulatory protein